jgi:Skp family chaperone for outer membrane proteins
MASIQYGVSAEQIRWHDEREPRRDGKRVLIIPIAVDVNQLAAVADEQAFADFGESVSLRLDAVSFVQRRTTYNEQREQLQATEAEVTSLQREAQAALKTMSGDALLSKLSAIQQRADKLGPLQRMLKDGVQAFRQEAAASKAEIEDAWAGAVHEERVERRQRFLEQARELKNSLGSDTVATVIRMKVAEYAARLLENPDVAERKAAFQRGLFFVMMGHEEPAAV